ncbi:MAG: hypothetical protein VX938_07230, partial [Myxococcota bacterium]|nr:hypothetical protein [Myxococcota bacterium]
ECNNVCGPGTVCNFEAGLCDDLTGIPGASCVNPLTVGELPFWGEGSTEGLANAYSYGADTCPGKSGGAGAGSSEAVWLFEPSSSGIYTLEVEPDFDATLYVVTDCEDVGGTCLAASDGFGTETLVLTLDAGTSYYIVVDGWSNSDDTVGAYTLTVSEPCVPDCGGKACGTDGCGGECENTCAETQTCSFETNECVDLTGGDTCEAAAVIDVGSLPVFVVGDNTDTVDDYDSSLCLGTGSEGQDIVYSFTIQESGSFRIALDSEGPTLAYLAADCAALDACVAGKDFWQGGHMDVALEGPATYYLVVDGWSGSEVGAFTVIIDEVSPSYTFMINEVD